MFATSTALKHFFARALLLLLYFSRYPRSSRREVRSGILFCSLSLLELRISSYDGKNDNLQAGWQKLLVRGRRKLGISYDPPPP